MTMKFLSRISKMYKHQKDNNSSTASSSKKPALQKQPSSRSFRSPGGSIASETTSSHGDGDSAAAASSSSASGGQQHHNVKQQQQQQQQQLQLQPLPVTTTLAVDDPLIQASQAWCEYRNRHELELLRDLCTPRCEVSFPDGTFLLSEYLEEVVKQLEAFPDFTFCYAPNSTVVKTSPNSVLIDAVQVFGTHTGKPYGYASYPEIPASGARVVNDPETMTTYFNEEGKITLLKFQPKGDNFGPAGWYRQLGGLIF